MKDELAIMVWNLAIAQLRADYYCATGQDLRSLPEDDEEETTEESGQCRASASSIPTAK